VLGQKRNSETKTYGSTRAFHASPAIGIQDRELMVQIKQGRSSTVKPNKEKQA